MIRTEVRARTIYGTKNDAATTLAGRRPVVGTRYYVTLLVCEGMASDGMWSSLDHVGLFATHAAAERFAEKVKRAVWQSEKDWNAHVIAELDAGRGYPTTLPASQMTADGRRKWSGLDLKFWTWCPSMACPFPELQKASTAVPFNID